MKLRKERENVLSVKSHPAGVRGLKQIGSDDHSLECSWSHPAGVRGLKQALINFDLQRD